MFINQKIKTKQMNEVKILLRLFCLSFISLLIISGCSEKNTQKKAGIYPEKLKYLVGYFNNYPVFIVDGENELIYLKNKKVYKYLKYEESLLPKFVLDSIVIFAKGKDIIHKKLGENQRLYKTNSKIINIGYNKTDSCIYFSNNYKQEIKKIHMKNGEISILPKEGHYLTSRTGCIYFYKYSDENDVAPIIDLYKLEIEEKSIPIKLGSKLSEEFLVISTDGKYILTDSYEEEFGTYTFCLNNNSRAKVSIDIPENFTFAYYSKDNSQFVYYNNYTLEGINVQVRCK